MKIANSSTSAVALIKSALEKAEKYKDYNIFTSLCAASALKKAEAIDKKIAAGQPVGRLAGVPYALKDNFLSPSGETTASAKILTGLTSPLSATSVEKLEAEGAICIGRTNLDAFAHGSSTENSFFGPTKNSADQTRVAGGSSGGSAVAVALGIVDFATGTDTGGSIRQPASFNGVFGIKPTYGTISRYGVVAMASSFDVVGFFAKSPADLDLLMQITSGQDEKDQTTLPDFYAKEDKPLRKKKIGVIKEHLNSPALAPELKTALESKLSAFKSKGFEIIELSLPTLDYSLAAYYILQPAEVASNLSRYDGVRYAFRANLSASKTAENAENPSSFQEEKPASTRKDASKLASSSHLLGFSRPCDKKGKSALDLLYDLTRTEGFMPENKRRIMIGNFVLSSGFYDAYFLKAAKARTLIIQDFKKAFEKVDAILSPVSPNPAFKLGEKTSDPVEMYLEDVFSVTANLAGLPAVAFPAGLSTSGLPLGLQLLGPQKSDKNLLELVEQLA